MFRNKRIFLGWGDVVHHCRVRKETGSQVLGSWNKQARANSGLYGVRGAAVVAV